MPYRQSSTATCEGNQIGISAHGIMFVHRNPTTAERAEIDEKFGPVDWAHFGPASDEEDGLAFLEEHHNALCDDAKQVRLLQTPPPPPPPPSLHPLLPPLAYTRYCHLL